VIVTCAIELHDVTKYYQSDLPAARSLNLSVARSEWLVLLGPSGGGKTTTLRLIAGLERPSSGTIVLDGNVVNDTPPHRRNVAMMFQRPALYPNRNVLSNLLFSNKLRRRDSGAADETACTIARDLGLEALLNRYPGELSGGEQQRLALGRTLVRQAAVLLLDEPLSNLDAPLRLEIRRELHLLRTRRVATIVLVTHDPTEAMALGDRIAVLDGGTLRQLATPVELWCRPAHETVARLLSPTMGCLAARLQRRETGLWLVTPSGAWPAPEHWSPHAGRTVRIGIRPDDVRLAATGEVPLQVTLVEPQPAGSLVTGVNAAGSMTVVEKDRRVTPGEKIMVKVVWPLTLVFDASTGALLAGPVA
jgi:multiple sugar transport system ATP-binding protein